MSNDFLLREPPGCELPERTPGYWAYERHAFRIVD